MGRASRRRQEKLTGVKQEKKVATYNYTEEQFRQEVSREVSELKKKIVSDTISGTVNTFIILSADTLHNRFNFGEKRLRRFFHDFYGLCDDLAYDDNPQESGLDINSIKQGLIDDGIDVEALLWNKITDKEVRSKEVDEDLDKFTVERVRERVDALNILLKETEWKASNVGEVLLLSNNIVNYADEKAYEFVFEKKFLETIEDKVLQMTILSHAAFYGVMYQGGKL